MKLTYLLNQCKESIKGVEFQHYAYCFYKYCFCNSNMATPTMNKHMVIMRRCPIDREQGHCLISMPVLMLFYRPLGPHLLKLAMMGYIAM